MDVDTCLQPRGQKRSAADLSLSEEQSSGRDMPGTLIGSYIHALRPKCGNEASVAKVERAWPDHFTNENVYHLIDRLSMEVQCVTANDARGNRRIAQPVAIA
jgi:hypothetical protein